MIVFAAFFKQVSLPYSAFVECVASLDIMCRMERAASAVALATPDQRREERSDQQETGRDEHLKRVPHASAGSARHFAGECQPCAWFYKPGGCQNDAECLHCHLCPEGGPTGRSLNAGLFSLFTAGILVS